MEIQSVLQGAGAFEHVAKMSRMVDSPPKDPPVVSLPPVRLRLSVFPLVSPPSSLNHDIFATASKPRSIENDSQTKSNKLVSNGHTREEEERNQGTDTSAASATDTDMDHKEEAEKERQRNKERQRRLQIQQDKEKDKENASSDTEKQRERRHTHKKDKRKRLKDAVKKVQSEEEIVPHQQESCKLLPGTAARRRKEARSKRWRKIEHSPPDSLEGKKPGRNMRATPSSRSRTSSIASGSTVTGSVPRDKELLAMLLEQQRSQEEPAQERHKERPAVKSDHKKKTNEANSRSNKKKYYSECDSLPVSVSSSRPPLYDTDISAQTEPAASKHNQRPSALDRLMSSGSLTGPANHTNENAQRPRAQRDKNRTKNERSSRRSKSKTTAASAWDSKPSDTRAKSSHPQVAA